MAHALTLLASAKVAGHFGGHKIMARTVDDFKNVIYILP